MKQNILARLLLFVAVLLGGAGTVKADHLAAVDLSVQYIGNGPTDSLRYKITLDVYRICEPDYGTYNNPNPPYTPNLVLFPTDYVTIHSDSGNFNLGVTVNQVGPEDTTDQLCPTYSQQNSCRILNNFRTFPGFVHRTYTANVVLPREAVDTRFYWNSCCRNLGAINLNNPGGAGLYVEVLINNKLRHTNSSPRYTAPPVPYICANRLYNYVNSPYDQDLDSMFTYNNQPRTYANAALPYAPGYNLVNPIASSSTYSVNSTNGTTQFTPTVVGKFVLGFKTEEYDRATHQLLGSITRDVMVSVLPCAGNNDPSIDSLVSNTTGFKSNDATVGNQILYACPGIPVTFDIGAHVNNVGGAIYLRPLKNTVLPTGMTINTVGNGGASATSSFSWTPTALDFGDHIITMEAIDSACGQGITIITKVYFVFTIRVLGPGLDAGPDLKVCPLGERPVQLITNIPATAGVTWTNLSGAPAEYLDCTDCPRPLANPPVDYTYVVSTDYVIYACKSTDTVNVTIDRSVTVTTPQNPMIVCRPGYVTLQAVTTGPSPLLNLTCGLANPIGCAPADQDTADIGGGRFQPSTANNTPFYSASNYHKYQYIISKKDLLNAGFYSGTINAIAFLHNNATVVGAAPLQNLTVSLACVPFDALPEQATNADFINYGTPVANFISYTLTPNAWNQLDFSSPYSWDTSMNLLVDICMGPMALANPGGTDPVAMTPGRAIQKFDNNINVCGGNGSSVQTYAQYPVTRLIFCPSPALPFSFQWKPGTYLQDSTVQNPRAYIAKSTGYAVYTTGRNGCKLRDTLQITVPVHHLAVGPQDSNICSGQPAFLYASGGQGYHWYEYAGGVLTDASGSLSCTDCEAPMATPRVTTSYAVVFDNDQNMSNPFNDNASIGCPDTLFTTLRVLPLPGVYSTNKDTTIGYGKSVQLFARGASNYTWTPVGSLSDPNSPAPIARPRETTTYIVTGLDSNGCAARDTVKVTVVFTEHLQIPTGFTPNGDGRNDVFRVVNASYQRLMEFRVFNRWGQEIFSTTDINDGWDGTWKGVPQEIGTYQYIIRVGSPDGNVERYQGDVTLIR